MSTEVLDRRSLNRATLARQLLLERSPISVLGAVEHLVGLQAQEPLDPYTALWSRLAGFDPGELAQLLLDRKVVRIVVMRGTIHPGTGLGSCPPTAGRPATHSGGAAGCLL